MKADPTLAKAWCRLGDAYRALGRWQLAHLAYTAARELAPEDPDLQDRKADAASHLDTVWAVEDIPHPTRDMMSGACSSMWNPGTAHDSGAICNVVTGWL